MRLLRPKYYVGYTHSEKLFIALSEIQNLTGCLYLFTKSDSLGIQAVQINQMCELP